MKGRSSFSPEEVHRIRDLLRRKANASRSAQKTELVVDEIELEQRNSRWGQIGELDAAAISRRASERPVPQTTGPHRANQGTRSQFDPPYRLG